MNKLLEEEEREIFEQFYNQLHEDFVLNKSSDAMSAQMACVYFVRLVRAIKGDNAETINKVDLLLSRKLSELKATKDKREGDIVNIKTSPAEWVTDFMEKAKNAEKRAAKRKKKSHICGKSPGSK